MSPFSVVFYATIIFFNLANAENETQERVPLGPELMAEGPMEPQHETSMDLEKALTELEGFGNTARNAKLFDPTDDIKKPCKNMITILREIIEFVKTKSNAYKFIKLKGIDRIIYQYIRLDNSDLKSSLVILIKALFDVAPTTTISSVPLNLVDQLLEIYEKENVALKAHVLDILTMWLPENPKVQARIMILKGLTPFYEQIAKLDTSVVKSLLDLFNKILVEHINARDKNQKMAIDAEKMKYYQKIGLLEHMQTPTVCNGLLNIFATSWTYNTVDNNILVTVFETIKNSKQFCWKYFVGKGKALKLFAALQDYVKDPGNKENFEANNVNITELVALIDDYVVKISSPTKEEL